LPRLAVLSVLSADSSPCPDLNLIHYTSRCRTELPQKQTKGAPSERYFQTAFPDIKEAKGSTVHRRRVQKDRERCRAALLLYEPAFGLTKSLSGEFDFFHDSEIFCLAVHKNGLHGLMLHPFDCGTVGGGIAAAAGDAGIADGTVGLNGETHGNFAVGAACVLEEAHFGSSKVADKIFFMFITFSCLFNGFNGLNLLEPTETVVPRCFDGRIMSMPDIFSKRKFVKNFLQTGNFSDERHILPSSKSKI